MNISRTILFSFLSMITGIALCMLFTCNDNSKDVRVIQPAELKKKSRTVGTEFSEGNGFINEANEIIACRIVVN